MSESGALPKGWEMVKLSDVGTFKSGSGFPLNAQGKTAGRYPFFKVSDFSNQGNERTLNRANHYIDESDRQRIGARVFQPGTIAFAKIGAAIFLERKRLIEQESCLDNNMAGFTLQNERVSRDLILANLRQFSLGSLVASTALPAIGSGELKGIAFPMPSSPHEQQAIAAALSDADGVVAGLERVIAKKRLIKQGAMQDLLTARRRLPGFSGEWEVKQLGDLMSMKSGDAITSTFIREEGDYPVFGGNGLRGFTSNFNRDGECTLVGRQGALCGVVTHTVGKIFASEHAIVCKATAPNCQQFISHRLEYADLNKVSESSAQPGLSVEKIKKIEIDVPLDGLEQRAIATVLSDMDAEIQILESRLVKARAVKEGMMQNLLTGRVRLV